MMVKCGQWSLAHIDIVQIVLSQLLSLNIIEARFIPRRYGKRYHFVVKLVSCDE